MPEKPIYDMIIVGGGLVGASLASALRSTKLKIAVIEAAPWFTNRRPPSYDDRIIALSYASHRIFSGIGIWNPIESEAVPINGIHVSDQGHFGFTRLNRQDLGVPALGYVVSASHLGQSLQQTLASSSIEILAPAQLVQITSLDKVIDVQIQKDNQLDILQTRLLVAADGGHSKVRQLLDFTVHETDYQQTAVIANVTLEYPHQNIAYERFTSSGPLALLPLRGNDCSLVWTWAASKADEVMAFDDQSFISALQRQLGWRLGRIMRVGQRHAYPLRLIRSQQVTHPRVVLIGNAAHTLHPVAGQGLNLGLRDVASLAQAVVDSVRECDDAGSEATLQRYQAWQQPDQQRVTTLTHTLVQVFSNGSWPLVMARNFGLLMTDALPSLKKQFVRQMTGLNGHSSRLVRGLPL